MILLPAGRATIHFNLFSSYYLYLHFKRGLLFPVQFTMQGKSLLSLVGGAALVAGVDLAGFQLAIDPTLLVVYGSTVGMGGAVVEKNGKSELASPAVSWSR